MRFGRFAHVRAARVAAVSGFGAVDSLLLLMALGVTIAAITALAFPGSGLGAILAKNNALSAMSQTFVHMNRPVSYFTSSGEATAGSPAQLTNELRKIAHAVDVSGNGFASLCVGVLESERTSPVLVNISVAAPGFVVWDRVSAGLIPCPRNHPELANRAVEMINSIGPQKTEVLLAAYSAEEHNSGRDYWLQIAQTEPIDPDFVAVAIVPGPPLPPGPGGPPFILPDPDPDPDPGMMGQFGGDPLVGYNGGAMPPPVWGVGP